MDDVQLLTSNDPEPGIGVAVVDDLGVTWVHELAVHGGSYWLRTDALDGDPESWFKVAGNYGPVRIVEADDIPRVST